MTDSQADEEFRGQVTQKAVIFNPEDEVLLVRSSSDNQWSIPGGRIQEGEHTEEALQREIREETSLAVTVGQPVQTMTDAWYTATGEPMFTVVYSCRTTEQAVDLNHEHETFEWVNIETARERMPLAELAVTIERAARVEC